MNRIILLCTIGSIYSTNFCNTNEMFLTLFKQAGTFFSQENFTDAADVYKKALLINPDNPQAHYNLGVTLFELKQFDEATQELKKALALQPSYARAHYVLGKINKEQSDIDQTIKHLKTALEIDPKYKEALYLLVGLLQEKLLIKEAIQYLEKTRTYFPNDIKLMFVLANTLNAGNRTQEALDLYLKVNEEHPNDAGLVYNIAYTYKKLGRLEEALPYYERALTLNPKHIEARFGQGLAFLVLGDFERGWEGYEYRWSRKDGGKRRTYNQPEWDGIASLDGKTIFVYAEQGLGDTFQFIRYLRELKKCGARIIFAPQRPLTDIVKLCPYIDEIVAFNAKPTSFDYHVPLVSLPYLCKTRIDSVPHEIPYLYADEALVEYWRKELEHDTNFRIGICWQGNPNYNTPFLRAAVAEKSLPAALFEPLTHIPGVTVYSLQHMTGTEQLASLPSTMKLHVFDGDFDSSHGRFCDTAAVIRNLDMVVSVDTSICHFAAALGLPVWNLLPNPADWRWMHQRLDTPWYPNMRLFRQPTPGDWQSCINAVVREITAIICPHINPQAPLSDTSCCAKTTTTAPVLWGRYFDTIAQYQALQETTHNNEQKKHLVTAIEKLKENISQQTATSPLLLEYLKTLRAIHLCRTKEHHEDVIEMLETVKESTIQKIDLLISMQQEDINNAPHC